MNHQSTVIRGVVVITYSPGVGGATVQHQLAVAVYFVQGRPLVPCEDLAQGMRGGQHVSLVVVIVVVVAVITAARCSAVASVAHPRVSCMNEHLSVATLVLSRN